MKEQVGKGAVLTAGIGCVTTGVALIKEGRLEFGIALVAIGFGLVLAYIYLMEKEVLKKVMRGKRR